ncbi:hypothetical protein [Cupriavidus oxalaticus]|uniref:DUF1351 domain-containing protein n=1 Tax=Cupriavidus oxalaticus TaxID=96344 RepID=A0A375GD83_9BURK|nr:hypothetical protein [Cupriavidus oxalaticus]QRQ86287.1 hypothetical protein JTE91_24070 [Cupriavidus oxalaticus]QRQ95386.1 hypothetical protein JTE92_18190 [Cupriavidus oxalaticus]WQD84040.1 hypothetical protein U0036_05895 [Cupriavidus oxalaticus]SPC17350.1 conserved hypothetical protein [Cupriavidus oxalaticus]
MGAPEIEVLDPVHAEPTTSLTLYDAIEAGLTELRTAGAEAFDVKNTEGNKEAREFVQRCVSTRTATEEAYTQWNRPILAAQKRVREKRDEILAAVKEIEQPVKEQIDAEQKRKDEERITKARAESARISVHQACLNAIAALPKDYLTASSADVSAAIRDLESPEYLGQRDWEEYADQAKEAVATALTTLRAHLDNAKAREELAAMKAQQEAEAAARRAEEAKVEAERKRVAGIKDRIHAIEIAPTTCIGLGTKAIQQRIDALAREAADDFAEFQAEAGAAIEAALGNLNTMLAAARDAEELAQLRADAARRKQEEQEAAERKVREEQDAKAAAERAEREAEAKRQAEARAAEQKRQRDEAEARRREKEAAEAAAQRVRAQAETLLALLVESRAHVPAGDLADRIDAAINAATGAQQ